MIFHFDSRTYEQNILKFIEIRQRQIGVTNGRTYVVPILDDLHGLRPH
jgi:hypothetical protein